MALTALLGSIGGGSVIPQQESLAQEQGEEQSDLEEELNESIALDFFTEVYDNRNVSAIDKYLASATTHSQFGGSFSPGDMINLETARNDVSAVFDAFPDLSRTTEAVVIDGDMVAIFNSWNGTHSGDFAGYPATGDKFNATSADLFRISDGQIVEVWHVGDYSRLAVALGERYSDENQTTAE